MTKKWKARLRFFAIGVFGGIGAIIWWSPWEFNFFPPPIPAEKPTLLNVKRAFPPGVRVTVVTAHPDDAEFYLGGTLPQIKAAGAVLSLVVVTDGDKGYYPFEDAEGNRKTRRREQTEAATAWGAKSVTYLGFPDGRVHSGDPLDSRVREALQALRPDIVLAFDDVYAPKRHHADHSRAAEAVAAVLSQLRTVRAIGRFSTEAPNRVVDATDTWDTKLALMKMHASQFVAQRSDPISRLMGRGGENRFQLVQNMVEWYAEEDGNRVDVSLGEGLRWTNLKPLTSR